MVEIGNMLRDSFVEFMRSRNVDVVETEHNKFMFNARGIELVCIFDDNDASLVKLMAMNVIHIVDLADECFRLDEFVNHMNSKFKLVKTFILHGYICMSIDQIVYSQMFADKVFERMIVTMVKVVGACLGNHVGNKNALM